jgi:hypothetical protein
MYRGHTQWGVAKRPKAAASKPVIREFKSHLPSKSVSHWCVQGACKALLFGDGEFNPLGRHMSKDIVYRDMFGIEYTAEELEAESRVWVCMKHRRHLPCRPCMYREPDGGGHWDSCADDDVEAVRAYQKE